MSVNKILEYYLKQIERKRAELNNEVSRAILKEQTVTDAGILKISGELDKMIVNYQKVLLQAQEGTLP